jgi:hypothetical protein
MGRRRENSFFNKTTLNAHEIDTPSSPNTPTLNPANPSPLPEKKNLSYQKNDVHCLSREIILCKDHSPVMKINSYMFKKPENNIKMNENLFCKYPLLIYRTIMTRSPPIVFVLMQKDKGSFLMVFYN